MAARTDISPAGKVRLFLVDSQQAVLHGIETLLRDEADLEICGRTTKGNEALPQILTLRPDLAIVGIKLHSQDGFEFIRQLRQHCPKLNVLVFSMHNQLAFVDAALQAGAHGYITKDDGSKGLVEAVRRVMVGEFYLTPAITRLAPGGRPDLRRKI